MRFLGPIHSCHTKISINVNISSHVSFVCGCKSVPGPDPTRRTILESLRDVRERPVTEIVIVAGISQSGVSRHLRILQEAGFVEVRPEGARRMYSLCQEPFDYLDEWLSSFVHIWNDCLDRLEVVIGVDTAEVRGNDGTRGI